MVIGLVMGVAAWAPGRLSSGPNSDQIQGLSSLGTSGNGNRVMS